MNTILLLTLLLPASQDAKPPKADAAPENGDAAAAPEDIWKELKVGDRVRVTFLSGNTLIGSLRHPPQALEEDDYLRGEDEEAPEPEPIDYTAVEEITVDLTWEYPGVNGDMTIRKNEVRTIEKLRKLDPAAREALEKAKASALAANQRSEEERLADQARREKTAEELREKYAKAAEESAALDTLNQQEKAVAEMKEALEIYKRFPPPEWGPHKVKDFQIKNINRVPLTLQEQEFLENIEKWAMADQYMKKKQEKEASQPAPSPEGGATPAPAPGQP